jgi:WD40 repeat protein
MRVLEDAGNIHLLRFLPGGRRLLTAVTAFSPSLWFEVWSLPDGTRVRAQLPELDLRAWWDVGQGSAVAVHPSGEWCDIAWAGRLYSFHTVDGSPRPPPANVPAHQVALSPDGSHLVAAHITPEAKELYSVRLDAPTRAPARRELRPTFRHLVGFLPDGERIVTVDDAVRVGTASSDQDHATAAYPAEQALWPGLSPDGRHLGVLSRGSLYLYDPAALGKPRKIAGRQAGAAADLESFAFHPGGKIVAIVHGDTKTVKVYDLATLGRVQAWNWKAGMLGAVAFSPDGLVGAAGSRTGRIVLWDVDPALA